MKSNPIKKLEFTQEAQDDFDGIMQYTMETWGDPQAVIYSGKLDKGFQKIIENPGIGKPQDNIFPEYRALSVEKHVMFYWERADRITVIRILHHKQHPPLHLSKGAE